MRKVLISQRKVKKRIKELALAIKKEYINQPFVFLGVLNGSYMFSSDLSKELWNLNVRNFSVDFIGLSSYGKKKISSRAPKITKNPQEILLNKHVLLVEDIIDSGHSVKRVLSFLKKQKCKTIKICSLLSKPSRREVTIIIDFLGFEIEDKWVEGYGMDTAGEGRGNPDIVEVIL